MCEAEEGSQSGAKDSGNKATIQRSYCVNGSMFTHDKIATGPSDGKSAPMEEAIGSSDFLHSRESSRVYTHSKPMQVEAQISHPFGQVFQRSRRTRSCPADRHKRLAQRFMDKACTGALGSLPWHKSRDWRSSSLLSRERRFTPED